MKYLKFKKLYAISTIERAARVIDFDLKRTLVQGPNQTGKSSLLKSIYWTLGAEPKAIHSKWKSAEVTCVLKFDLDGEAFTILRRKNTYAVFNSADSVIARYQTLTKGIGVYLAQLFNFQLKLSGRDAKEPITPPPAFQFLPYYIDQDASWKSNWDGFDKLSQFSNWRRDVAEFHLGIRPNDYYVLKGQRSVLQNVIEERKVELKILEDVRSRLRETFKSIEFDLDTEAFQEEVADLVASCNRLLARENDYKATYSSQATEKAEVEEQLQFTKRAAAELQKDYKFATDLVDSNDVPCPVCGTEYQNSFSERFEMAADEDDLQVLVADLTARSADLTAALNKTHANFIQTESELNDIKRILDRKREAVTFAEILKSGSKAEADAAIKSKYDECAAIIADRTRELDRLNIRIKAITDKERAQRIVDKYRSRMGAFLRELQVPTLSEKGYAAVQSRIEESGSALPRALLAYYFSVLDTIREFGDSTFFPVVLDSPNQQAQDKQGLTMMLSFIRDHQPEGSQLILGLEEDLGIVIPGTRIEMSDKYHALQENQYDEVNRELKIFIDQSFSLIGG